MLNPTKFISLQPRSKRNGSDLVGSGLLLVSLLLLVSVPTGAINAATVGNTDVFAEPYAPANRRAVPFTMPESGTIQSITMFHDGGSSGNMLLAVYDDNQGYPGSRIAVTSETAIDILPGWQTIDLISPVYVEVGARIWLAWVYEDMPAVREQQTTPENARASTDPPKYWSDIPKMPLSFGGCNLYTPWTYSIYATYTPAGTPDEDPPTPNPSTWASPPFAVNFSTITMAATPAADASGVEYYFDETSGNPGGTDSGWQHSNTYTDYGLAPKKQYAYRVKTRDLSPLQNDGDWSTSEFADTPEAPVTCPEVDLNGNCQVDFQDLWIFAMQWLDKPGCPGHPDDCANLDRQDNGINFDDYSFLADEWRKSGILVVINEFMASNGQTIADPCDNDYEDWIEIYNASTVAFDVRGMWLADEQERWQIPDYRPDKTTIAAGGYLIIWADEESWQGPLHADFKINKDRDELSLFAADGTLIDHVDVHDQSRDMSHGRYPDAVGPWHDMSEPTPGSTNSIGMAPIPHFSHPAGTFTTDFSLGLTTTSPSAKIYYTTNGAEPDEMSTLYTAPFTVAETTWVRARACEPNLAPGPIVSNPYVKLHADLQNFQSDLPIVIIDSFGLYIDGANRDFHEVLSVFIDTDSNTGRATITGPADYAGCGGMHVRGASSSFYPKKPYRFETWDENRPDPDPRSRYLDKSVSLLGLPEESDWIFYGPCSDKTLMRNYQMYTWSNLIGRYASRTIFVELFTDYDGDGVVQWNGGQSPDTDYRGIYVLMEKIKRDENRVNVAKLEPHHNSEPEITGGYLLKKDWEWDGFETDIYKDFLIYSDPESDELTATQKNWLKAYFNDFETVLSAPGFNDPVHGYAAYIDVGSFVDHHILVEVAKNVDGFVLSTYLFKDRNGKINMGPIWDYNGSLGGADYFCNYDPNGWLHEFDEHTCSDASGCGCTGEGGATFPADNRNAYKWYARIFQDPEFLLKYADRWFELREHVFDTRTILGDIDTNVALLTDNNAPDNPVERNYTRWDIDEELWPNLWDNCHTNTAYMDYVNWMKTWLTARLAWMDGEIDAAYGKTPPAIHLNGAPANRGGHAEVGDVVTITKIGDGTTYYTIDGNDPRQHGGTIAPSAFEYTTNPPAPLSGTKQFKARIRYSTGDWSAMNEATFAVGPVAENLRITEIMYHPEDTHNPNDANAEFIELKNVGIESINLNLVKFTDGVDFTFPDVNLAAGAHILVLKDQNVFTAKYGSGLNTAGQYSRRLSNAGERITLQDAIEKTILDFRFKDGWYHITDGNDFSLNIIDPANSDVNAWEHSEYWQPASIPGGTPCADDSGHVAAPGDIVINEVMTHTDTAPGDWIELHNTTDTSVDISGWFLSDSDDNFRKYEVAPSKSIPPNGYVVFTQNDHFGNLGDPGCRVPFALSEHGETVYLSSGSGGKLTGGFCTKEDFKAAERGVTLGRYTKSPAAANDVDFVALEYPTYESLNADPCVGPVVISEIMYHPATTSELSGYAEYIELHNVTDRTVLLYDPCHPENTWQFTDETGGIEFYFPPDANIPPLGYLLAVKNKVAFSDEFAAAGGVQIFEWIEGRLSNSGEKIQISKPGSPEPGFVPYVRVDRINYSDGRHPENFAELGYDPWPAPPDGGGDALHRMVSGNYGNDVANWLAAGPTPGE